MPVQMQRSRHQQTRESYERNQCQGKQVFGTIDSAIYRHLSTKPKCTCQIYWQTFLVSVQALLCSLRLQLHQLQLNLDQKEPVTKVTLANSLALFRVQLFMEYSS